MGEICKSIATLTVSSIQAAGANPAAGMYICAQSAIATGPFGSPVVCRGAIAVTELGVILNSHPMASALLKQSLNKGCTVVADVTEKSVELTIVGIKESKRLIGKNVKKANKIYSTMNSREGIYWLMNRLKQ